MMEKNDHRKCMLDLFSSVIATPGRFLHVIVEMDLKLASVEYVVFDEADRLGKIWNDVFRFWID